ncbi:DUF2249 domain-containing protein [Rhodospirillum rubrum]|uniref:DUF2249 domain-containing protein n=1 Tax=Rhodospirillum rubrum (strain ATCC 11170 / ATH 1.1.1 / DSM 467 / LMG 4362 / NCIMB 8255 / S1) TaxID=269796 RepID=Q2RR04_RHORT|nr:DUF2249 domain-containing protein [Rhodospirillum rubrum]ABC23441.1 hypothetical protein Rru_A2644 [Rhodospirillum rubrum ATCC 11170]AEO49179.1 hypothetical protein F11_13585 [Rhodospirillum rubrum F11]MBK5955111.1 hypothetical protein [Rhodospirillum rubrum]QXG79412.1 DUF2249 domain-containing protein [Rhodospirillum rubrum]HAP98604.1 DUF2249 domain-containing protein [Rhodospirillum rubrum]
MDDDTSPDLDLRGLAPPAPMVAILTRIDEGRATAPFTVTLPHYPAPLFEELERRGWDADVLSVGLDGARLRLFPARRR